MKYLHTVLAAFAIAAAATVSAGSTASAASRATEIAKAADHSAAKRTYHRRQVRHYRTPHYGVYRGGNDPSLAPNGGPYRVPAHLRNQCHIDEGYGRFSACPNE
jgi:hypothetical protein